jgi:pyruvate/2-oxoglutarate/acetoin dehydrogenase E1 component
MKNTKQESVRKLLPDAYDKAMEDDQKSVVIGEDDFFLLENAFSNKKVSAFDFCYPLGAGQYLLDLN